MVSNKLMLFVATLCIISVFLGIVLILGNNGSNNNDHDYSPTSSPIINAKINNFTLTGIDNPVGLVWNTEFSLGIFNNGTIDAENLTIIFSSNSTYNLERDISLFNSTRYYLKDIKMTETYAIGTIKVGETKQVDGEIWNNLLDDAKIRGFVFIATLKIDDKVIDEAVANIP